MFDLIKVGAQQKYGAPISEAQPHICTWGSGKEETSCRIEPGLCQLVTMAGLIYNFSLRWWLGFRLGAFFEEQRLCPGIGWQRSVYWESAKRLGRTLGHLGIQAMILSASDLYIHLSDGLTYPSYYSSVHLPFLLSIHPPTLSILLSLLMPTSTQPGPSITRIPYDIFENMMAGTLFKPLHSRCVVMRHHERDLSLIIQWSV